MSLQLFLYRQQLLFYIAYFLHLLQLQKKIGNAVKRNKIKRRLRNIVNEAVKKVTLKFSYSYLVIAKSTMLNNEYKNIKETLFQDFEKIK